MGNNCAESTTTEIACINEGNNSFLVCCIFKANLGLPRRVLYIKDNLPSNEIHFATKYIRINLVLLKFKNGI